MIQKVLFNNWLFNQICILNQELLNKYLEYDGTKEI